jgi:hypothetical protein
VPVTEQTPYARAREQIGEAIQASAELTDLEHELLDQVPLSRDARDALWLFAWDAIERRDRHSAPWRWHWTEARAGVDQSSGVHVVGG